MLSLRISGFPAATIWWIWEYREGGDSDSMLTTVKISASSALLLWARYVVELGFLGTGEGMGLMEG